MQQAAWKIASKVVGKVAKLADNRKVGPRVPFEVMLLVLFLVASNAASMGKFQVVALADDVLGMPSVASKASLMAAWTAFPMGKRLVWQQVDMKAPSKVERLLLEIRKKKDEGFVQGLDSSKQLDYYFNIRNFYNL